MNKIFLYKFLNKGTFINERNMQYTKVFALNQKEIRERVPIIMINFLNLKNALANKDKDLS